MLMIERFINNRKKGGVAVIMLSSIFVFIFYGNILLSPNSYLFNPSGDGMKNYYTYAYYIQNNKDLVEFEGMNYPYSESFMYTDCHPIQAIVLKFLTNVFPSIGNYSVGLVNLAMILSIVLTSLVLHLLFNRLKINQLLSVLSAVAVTALSPQIFRLTGGHYALSYSFFIPLIIYFLLKFEEEVTLKSAVYFGLIILLAFFTHAYIGMILFVLIFIFYSIRFIHSLLNKSFRNELKNFFFIATASLIPFILFYLFIKLTDSHIGRTSNPWGIFENHADLGTVFLPVDGPLNGFKEYFFVGLKQNWEGWAYIGIISIIGFITYLLSFVFSSVYFKRIKENQFIKTLFLSAILILLFATLLPFRQLLYRVVDEINMIKQFRSIGRFAWVFFFIINIVTVYCVNELMKFLKENSRINLANTIIIIVPLVIFIESISYHTSTAKTITTSNNLFDINQTDSTFKKDINLINAQDYQAIIGLPFFYIGSENFGKTAPQEAYKLSFLFSYHLNLPMVNSFLTRTSIMESKKIMQLLSKGFYNKPISKDLQSNKPFLIVSYSNNLSLDDQELISRASLITEEETYSLYEISLDSIFKNISSIEYQSFLNKKDLLYTKEDCLVSDTNLYFSSNNFNDTNLYQKVNNEICYVGFQKDYNSIFKVNGNDLQENKSYIARFWMLNNGKKFGQDYQNGMIFFNKSKGNESEWVFPLKDARNSHNINGNWSLVEVELSNVDKEYTYELLIKGPDRSKQNFYVDDLLFYDSELEIYRESRVNDSILLIKNNHRIKAPVFSLE